MEIISEITGINYKVTLAKELKIIDFSEFDINKIPSCCLIADKNKIFAISKWVSPKRTRSYPYERVYNTLSYPKKITIIPVVKDEGYNGDRDYLQWDTVSLMSLLDVYIILAYYNKADKHKTRENKITNQQFDNDFIIEKINEIESYHSSALHWNLKEIKENISIIIDKAKKSYSEIETKLNIKLHGISGLDNLKKEIQVDMNSFMEYSRQKAKEAQSREILTNQPKESLLTSTKAKITITNYLGGKYYLTVDEIVIRNNTISLIESKHSKSGILPSINDIKDGLIKMFLFTNLNEIFIDNKKYKRIPILQLTSPKVNGIITSNSHQSELITFCKTNKLSSRKQEFLNKLFEEARTNNFKIKIQNG